MSGADTTARGADTDCQQCCTVKPDEENVGEQKYMKKNSQKSFQKYSKSSYGRDFDKISVFYVRITASLLLQVTECSVDQCGVDQWIRAVYGQHQDHDQPLSYNVPMFQC